MVSWYVRHSRRTIKGLAFLGICILLLWPFRSLYASGRRYNTWTWKPCPGLSPFEQSCTASRAAVAKDTLVVVKTGASEPRGRLRAQLATMLAKVPRKNILIFSDMEEQESDFRLHDVYADLSLAEKKVYPEFALYDAQKELQRQGKEIKGMDGGWDLAKYMNLAMKRHIWKMPQKSMKWFVFIDTDTFIDWDNLFELLVHHNPTDGVYIGSPVWLPKLEFAHGGSAYVLSHGAMKALNKPGSHDDPMEPMYSQYGFNTTALCCGDEALARVLKAKEVRLKGYWPMFNGEIPATLAFGRDLWCEPVVSLHHLGGEDMRSLWKWVEAWKERTKSEHPLLFKDLFQYIAPLITMITEDWDNSDESIQIQPTKKASHASFWGCKEACEADTLCFQFVYDGTTCKLSHHIRLGRKRLSEDNGLRTYYSGWEVERIKEWTAETECPSAHWLVSNP